VVLTGTAGIYFFLQSIELPPIVVFRGTTATAILVGRSSLYVVSRSIGIVGPVGESSDESGLTRVTEVIVSVSVLSAVTIPFGSIGKVGLTILARLGGPRSENGGQRPPSEPIVELGTRKTTNPDVRCFTT